MIRVEPVPEPAGFLEQAQQPGQQWLAKHPSAKRPADFWSPFKGQLADGFSDLCAYSAMYEPAGTVDHFVSFAEDRDKAYQWNNYRFAAQWVNASKQRLASAEMLDPFEIEDDWFELLLPSLQLVATNAVPAPKRALAEFVLVRLRLRDDERVVRQRRSWLSEYERGGITLAALERKAPLLDRAIRKREESR